LIGYGDIILKIVPVLNPSPKFPPRKALPYIVPLLMTKLVGTAPFMQVGGTPGKPP
jgi:hypothetical protein